MLFSPKLWLIDNSPLNSYSIKKNDFLYLYPKVCDSPIEKDGICFKVNFSACNTTSPFFMNQNKKITKSLPGELLILKIDNIIHLTDYVNGITPKGMVVDIYMTNYQLKIFTSELNQEYNIPLYIISRIERVGSSKSNTNCYLDLYCKDSRFVRFLFPFRDGSRKKFYQTLKAQVFPGIQTKLFAFYNNEQYSINGWKVYNPESEYKRLGIVQGSGWRITRVNEKYEKCDSYPALLVVPESIYDGQLDEVFQFRSRGRIPVLSWRHPINHTTITRCSQPLVGLTRNRSFEDENLIKEIGCREKMFHSNKRRSEMISPALLKQNSLSNLHGNQSPTSEFGNQKTLYVLDCRPKANALGNRAMGAGYENTTCYPCCNIDFLNIDNIHVMRTSFEKLKETCIEACGGIPEYSSSNNGTNNNSREKSNENNNNSNNANGHKNNNTNNNSNGNLNGNDHYQDNSTIRANNSHINNVLNQKIGWFAGIDSSHWFDHIITILSGTIFIVETIHFHSTSVLIHCSDGWDRTSQNSSLAMILLDPFYRTLKGFIILIEKEWLSFGHKLAQRCGHGDPKYNDEQRSPVFIQFIECIYHITQQFPNSFEFNETLLLDITHHLYTCRFGTFLFNSEKERKANRLAEQTVSMWSMVLSNQDHYTNPLYVKTEK
eukprot:gene1248-1574_t